MDRTLYASCYIIRLTTRCTARCQKNKPFRIIHIHYLRHVLVHGSLLLSTSRQRLSSSIVRSSVAEPTPSIPGLRNDGTGTLAALEAAAPRCTVRVAQTLSGDELLASSVSDIGCSRNAAIYRCRGRLGWRWGSCSAAVTTTTTIVIVVAVVASRGAIRSTRGSGSSRGGRTGTGTGTSRKSLGGVAVGRGVAESTSTITSLGDDCTGTKPTLEATASRGAVGVAFTLARNELFAGSVAHVGSPREVAVDGGRSTVRGTSTSASAATIAAVVAAAGRCSRGCCRHGSTAGQCIGCVGIGRRITEATSSIAFLGDHGTCAFARVETAAPRGAVCIGCARAGDELGALT